MNATYRYAVNTGNAPDAWSASFTFTDATGSFNTKIVEVKIWDNPGYVRFSYRGVTFGDAIELDPDDQPMQIPHSAAAVQIMNVTPTVIARYQIIGYA